MSNSMITVVWSAYGHTFITEDGTPTCLNCGAGYTLSPVPERGDNYGRYHANNGDDPMDCYDLRGKVHGIERNCEVDNGRSCTEYGEPCEHTDHDCNCVFCA